MDGPDKIGTLNVDLSQIPADQEIAIFNVSRSFGSCKDNSSPYPDISFPCPSSDLIKGYDHSLMLAQFSKEKGITQFCNMEGGQGSDIRIMIKDAQGHTFNYLNKFSPIRLIDESPEGFFDRVFNSLYTHPHKSSTETSHIKVLPTPEPQTSSPTQESNSTKFSSATEPQTNTNTLPTDTRSQTSYIAASNSTTKPQTSSSGIEESQKMLSEEFSTTANLGFYSQPTSSTIGYDKRTTSPYISSQPTMQNPMISPTPLPAIGDRDSSNSSSAAIWTGVGGAVAAAGIAVYLAYRFLKKPPSEPSNNPELLGISRVDAVGIRKWRIGALNRQI